MHELSVTQSILDIAIEHAEKAGASRISQIDLIIGEMSGIVNESVSLYFDYLSKDTIAAGATLAFEPRPTVFCCQDCGTTYHPESFEWDCPACESINFEILSGREFQIASILVDEHKPGEKQTRAR
jgi:hydrogenase nickel incorporation protein HypA/HybF